MRFRCKVGQNCGMRDDKGATSTMGPPSLGGQGGSRRKIVVKAEIRAREADKVAVSCTRKFRYDPWRSSGQALTMEQISSTGGEGQYTQWVHCELIVGSEIICLAHTQQVNSGHFQKVPTHLPSPNPGGK